MARDPKSIARLAAVQARKRQLAEWKLSAETAELARLASERDALFAALDGGLPNDLKVPLVARRLLALEREAAQVEQRRVTAQARVQDETRRAKLADRLSEEAAREDDRAREATELERTLESWQAARTQGSHKLGKP